MSKTSGPLILAFVLSVSFSFALTAETDAQCLRRGKRCGFLSRIQCRRDCSGANAYCNAQQCQCVKCCIANYDPLSNEFQECLIRCDAQRMCCEQTVRCGWLCQRRYADQCCLPAPIPSPFDADCDAVHADCIKVGGTCPCSSAAACVEYCKCAKERCEDNDWSRICTCLNPIN